MTREEFESLQVWDKVCIYERRIGIVVMAYRKSFGTPTEKIQVRWESSGWENTLVQEVFEIDDKGVSQITKLPEIVSTPPRDFPNVWTGYVSKTEAEELAGEIGSLRKDVVKLEYDNRFLNGVTFLTLPASLLVWIVFIGISIYGLFNFAKTILSSI